MKKHLILLSLTAILLSGCQITDIAPKVVFVGERTKIPEKNLSFEETPSLRVN